MVGGAAADRRAGGFDPAPEDGGEGCVTITCGKGTTLRAMAEAAAAVVANKLGVDEPCRTRETVLLPHTDFYPLRAQAS